MDSNLESSPVDSGDAKAAFRKPDTANRKYRCRSPVTCSSPSEGSPVHEHSSRPKFSKEDPGKVTEYRTRRDNGRDLERDSDRNHYGRNSDSYRQSDRQASRSSHGYYRHNDYIKHDKDTDEEERQYHKLSSRSVRESRGSAYSDHVGSRHYSRHLDKYSRDQYDASGYRSKDKNRESSFLEKQKFNDKDSSSERVGSGRRHGNFEEMHGVGEGNRHALEKDFEDEKKDCRRNSGDRGSGHISSYEEYKGQRSDSISSEDDGKNCLKEGFNCGLKKLDDENLSKAQR